MSDDRDQELHLPNDRWASPEGVAGAGGCCLVEALGCAFFSGISASLVGLVVLWLSVAA